MTRWGKRARLALVWGALALLLSSCYLPDQFRAEVRISRAGAFALSYYGDLVYAPLYSDIVKGKLEAEQITEKTAVVRRDLTRDPNFKEVTDKGRARFGVKYERAGVLDKTSLVTFVRRDTKIITIRSAENGRITVTSANMSAGDRQQLMQLGVSLKGEFRVTTDATVLEHNASEVRPFGEYQVYIWRIENALSPSPRLVMLRAG